MTKVNIIIKDNFQAPKKIWEKIVVDNWFRKIISKDFEDKKWNKSNFLIASHVWISEAIVVLPITENKEILYIKEFRYWLEENIISFPMWWLEKGLKKMDIVKKELKEETWYESTNIQFLFDSIVSNYENTKVFHYFAKDCKIWKQDLESTEFIEVKNTSIENFEKMILDWEVKCPLTISCFFFAKRKKLFCFENK